ncbi:MAG: lysophospholipid acyltransferase family protein [Lachnospirales bacterium]
MFRSIYWYSNFILSLIKKQSSLKKVDKLLEDGKNEEYEKVVYELVTNWAENRIKASGAKINIYGKENIPDRKGILFVANHQSNFDILSLLAYLGVPKGFVAKTELGKIPMLSDWMKRIHCLFMDRNDMKQSAQTIIDGIKQLKAGINMVIFPEGTRGKKGVMGEFKAGSFKLATKAKAPIVPITIDGTYKIMEGNNNFIKPASVNIYVHPPIFTDTLTKEEQNELPERVEKIVKSKLS